MEGDLVFCFVAFGLDLGSWLLALAVAVVRMTILRERERGVVGVVTFEIWVLFFLVSLNEGKKVCIWVFFFFLSWI